MTTSNPRLLTPPREKEEIYPYRSVWRSFAVEAGLMTAVTGGVFITVSLLGVEFPAQLFRPLSVALALLPLGLWFLFSWWSERSVPQPRRQLMTVAILSALVANAVGIPVINDFFQVERWLPLASAIDRILGYTFTVGLVQEILKYLVIRYTVWPDHFRTRLDGVAYGVAAAIGYVTVAGLHTVLAGDLAPDVAALRVFALYVLHLTTSLIVAYGLAEVRFGSPTIILQMVTLALAAFLTGISIPVRAGLVNASLSVSESISPRSLFGFGFSVVMLIAPAIAMLFLFGTAERQAAEAAGRED